MAVEIFSCSSLHGRMCRAWVWSKEISTETGFYWVCSWAVMVNASLSTPHCRSFSDIVYSEQPRMTWTMMKYGETFKSTTRLNTNCSENKFIHSEKEVIGSKEFYRVCSYAVLKVNATLFTFQADLSAVLYIQNNLKWAAAWQNQQNGCAPSEDLDQPGHPPILTRVFPVRMKKAWVLSYPLRAQRRLWSD